MGVDCPGGKYQVTFSFDKSSWLLVKLSRIFWLWKCSWVFGKSILNLGYFWFRQFTEASGEWLLIVLTPKPDWTASKIICLPKCVLNSAAILLNVVLKFWWLLVHFTQAIWICTVNYIFKCIVIEIFLKSEPFWSKHIWLYVSTSCLNPPNHRCFCKNNQDTVCNDLNTKRSFKIDIHCNSLNDALLPNSISKTRIKWTAS